MKSSVVYVLVFAIIGSAVCARHRRQLSPAAGGMVAPPGIQTPPKRIKDPSDVKAVMMGDINNQAAMGVPIQPDKIDSMIGADGGDSKTGQEIANPSKEKIDGLQTPPEQIVGDAA